MNIIIWHHNVPSEFLTIHTPAEFPWNLNMDDSCIFLAFLACLFSPKFNLCILPLPVLMCVKERVSSFPSSSRLRSQKYQKFLHFQPAEPPQAPGGPLSRLSRHKGSRRTIAQRLWADPLSWLSRHKGSRCTIVPAAPPQRLQADQSQPNHTEAPDEPTMIVPAEPPQNTIGAKIITCTTSIVGELISQMHTHELRNFLCRGIDLCNACVSLVSVCLASILSQKGNYTTVVLRELISNYTHTGYTSINVGDLIV